MKHIGLAVVVYTSFALQVSVAPGMLGSMSPHFLFCAIVVAALSMDHWSVMIWAAAIGLLSDCLRPHMLGIDMFVATLVALGVQLIGVVNRRRRGLATTALLCLAIPLAAALATAGIRAVVIHPPGDLAEVLTNVVGVAVTTGVCSFGLLICGDVAGRLLHGFGFRERSTASNRYSEMY